jgi:alpha-glucosidase
VTGLENQIERGHGAGSAERPWWQDAVVYQIYPRSFADSNGDGVGDLPGIRSRLDYLAWLGVDAIWISPFYPSPMADFGYDVSDYCDVDPVFGTLGDFDALLADAHERGLRVLIDWVPNHTSSEHPWFVESRSSRESAKRDWYVWRDGSPGLPPNNWRATFGGRAWTWDERTAQWYLHLFLPEQPDLDWSNPEVASAMHDVLRFWLGRGVDGFRVDVVHLIGKDPLLPDRDPELEDITLVHVYEHEGTHELLRGIRAVLDEYGPDRILVGEVSLRDTLRISTYYGAGDELHLAFNFLSIDLGWSAADWKALVQIVGRDLGAGAWPTWVLSNHDSPRHRSRFGGAEEVARAAAVLLLTLRGTPFVYQGEELGLLDAGISATQAVDPGGRDGCRAPIPWTADPPHGWAGGSWLPFPPDAARCAVETQRADGDSFAHLYRRLLRHRRESVPLRAGSLELLDAPDGVLAYVRSADGEDAIVAVNFSAREVPFHALAGADIAVSSVPRREGASDGCLLPNEAVVARPGRPGVWDLPTREPRCMRPTESENPGISPQHDPFDAPDAEDEADTRERVLEGGEDAGDGDVERVRRDLGLEDDPQ